MNFLLYYLIIFTQIHHLFFLHFNAGHQFLHLFILFITLILLFYLLINLFVFENHFIFFICFLIHLLSDLNFQFISIILIFIKNNFIILYLIPNFYICIHKFYLCFLKFILIFILNFWIRVLIIPLIRSILFLLIVNYF